MLDITFRRFVFHLERKEHKIKIKKILKSFVVYLKVRFRKLVVENVNDVKLGLVLSIVLWKFGLLH